MTPKLKGFFSAEDMSDAKTKKFLIYGPSGSGKTTLACTAPDPYFALAEIGRSSRRIAAMAKTLGKKIEVAPIETKDDMDSFMDEMEKVNEVKTVVFDSATDFYRPLVEKLLGKKDAVPQRNDWQIIQSWMESTLRRLVNLNHHVIVLAGPKEYITKEKGEEVRRIVPAFSGDSMPAYIGKLFHAVGFTMKRTDNEGFTRYITAFESEDRILTKVDDGLDPIEGQHVQKWMDKIDAAYDKGSHMYAYDELPDEVKSTLPTSKEAAIRQSRPAPTV